jgi:hypothetical protein
MSAKMENRCGRIEGDRPGKLILDGGGSFREGYSVLLAGLAWMAFVFAIALMFAGADPGDLVLPMAALGTFWAAWMAIHAVAGFFHRRSNKRDILCLFAGEIWQCWQFEAGEWRAVVESEYRKDVEAARGGLRGILYSALLGLVMGVVLVLVGELAVTGELARTVFQVAAVAVLLLLAAVGLFQPLRRRWLARRRWRRALGVARPRLWFGSGGVYHEAFGYTSLKGLVRVSDRMRMAGSVAFAVRVKTAMGGAGDVAETEHVQSESFVVPAASREQAVELLQRYRLLLKRQGL